MDMKVIFAVLVALLVLFVILASNGNSKEPETYTKSPGCTCGRADGNSVVCTCGPVTYQSAESFGDIRFDPAESGKLNALNSSTGSMGSNNVRIADKSSRFGF